MPPKQQTKEKCKNLIIKNWKTTNNIKYITKQSLIDKIENANPEDVSYKMNWNALQDAYDNNDIGEIVTNIIGCINTIKNRLDIS